MPATEIRITDSYIIKVVEQEQELRGDTTLTRTAGRMITERAAQLEMSRDRAATREDVGRAGRETAEPSAA